MGYNMKKIIANKMALSFFLASIVILIIYIFFYNKVVYYANIINTTSISLNNTNNKKVEYDKLSKRLTKYPYYGEKYAELIINSINLDLPIYHGDNLNILNIGVGHYAGSYFPGEGGTIVLAAHNTKQFFGRFDQLNISDIINIETIYGDFNYIIDDIKIVDEFDEEAFIVNSNKEQLLLYTCYPINTISIGRRTKRFVVYASIVGETYE